MISGDLDYVVKERLQEIRQEIEDVGRMLKAMIKSLENKPLDPGPLVEDPVILTRDPLSQLIGRRSIINNSLWIPSVNDIGGAAMV